jgi:hypothetical protein
MEKRLFAIRKFLVLPEELLTAMKGNLGLFICKEIMDLWNIETL